jgi:putative two-component system response regulator
MTSASPPTPATTTAELLARLVKHHADTHRHSLRVARLAVVLAENAGVALRLGDKLGEATQLHDIGKLAIPAALLNKTGGLSAGERTRFQRHTHDGAALLAPIAGAVLAQAIAQNHHERWDGSGYPAGLSGEAIPLGARLVALADVYDALRAARAYKDGRTHPEVLATMTRMNQQFDPNLLTVFLVKEAKIAQTYDKAQS